MPKNPAYTYEEINDERIDYEFLRNKLKLKQIETKQRFQEQFPHLDKFIKEKGLDFSKIRKESSKLIGAGLLTGTLFLSPPLLTDQLPTPQKIFDNLKTNLAGTNATLPQKELIDILNSVLPKKVRPLSSPEEKFLEQTIFRLTGINSKANLEGEHLNTTYGLIGAEQHLFRYPGDNLEMHGQGDVIKEGIAPGLGAWGYFANSKNDLTANLENTEKWYAVVQTLYLPDWSKRLNYLRQWYKYRKVLILNTVNGNAVVAAIADSGPAAWTGKHFGGSPEVMEYLGGPRYKKGPVIIFFIDDPENKIPLGPIEYNKINVAKEIV